MNESVYNRSEFTETNVFAPVSWSTANSLVANIDSSDAVRTALETPRLFPCRPGSRIAFPAEAHIPTNLWFVGDIHGDLLALVNAWYFISIESFKRASLPHVVFLGDLIDRGPYSHQVLIFLSWLMVTNPGRIQLVKGNHDTALSYDNESASFVSEVCPSEYASFLNQEPVEKNHLIGHFAIECFRAAPAAIVLPDGLLASHAGVPHTDLQCRMICDRDLDHPDFIQDFIWLRLSQRSQKKIPNRNNKGCEFGIDDFIAFCSRMNEFGHPVYRMVRGHDHLRDRYSVLKSQGIPTILTLNSFGHWLDDEVWSATPPTAFVAMHQHGQLPLVCPVPIRPSDVTASIPRKDEV